MPVANDGIRTASGLDDQVREGHSCLDFDRGHVRDVDRFFLGPDPLRGVLDHAGRRDAHLGWEEPIAPRPSACLEDVALHEGPVLARNPDPKTRQHHGETQKGIEEIRV